MNACLVYWRDDETELAMNQVDSKNYSTVDVRPVVTFLEFHSNSSSGA